MLCKFLKKRKGSLTVEATLVLPLVIITLLFVTNILNICMVHLCMQQALNNTIKKISQDSYIVYRLAGEEKYSELMNSLNDTINNYDTIGNNIINLKESFTEVQSSVNNTINSTNKLLHTFDGIAFGNILEYPAKFAQNVNNFSSTSKDTIDKSNVLIENAKKMLNSENYKSAFIKLLLDSAVGASTTTISNYLFEKYKNDLNLPASKIKDLNFFNSSINKDGKITVCISYYYVNPFSFVNHKKMEYSVINKEIKMVNIVSVKPFVGKSDTSIKKKLLDDGIGINSEDDIVFIPDSAYECDDDATRRYHLDPYCSNMKGHVQRVKLSEVTKEGSKITGPCSKCYK